MSGTVTIKTQESSKVSWINVFADGVWFASNDAKASRPYSVRWNSTTVPNGIHAISVTGYSSGNRVLARSSVQLNVANGAAGSPTAMPTLTPTPVATASAARTASATPTPQPSVTHTVAPATPTRTPAPTSTPSPAVNGSAYYVSPRGSDSAAGTSAAPWLTIQHAVSKLIAGQTAVVESRQLR